MTQSEIDRAFLAGITAKQAGRPLSANRFRHHPGRDGELLRNAWDDGHSSVNKPETTDAD